MDFTETQNKLVLRIQELRTQYSEIENSEKTENYLTELTSSLSEKMYLFKMNHIQYKNNGGNFPIYLHYITDFQDFFQKVNYEII